MAAIYNFILNSVLYGLYLAYLAHWTVTHMLQTYLDNKDIASLQTGLLIICCICLYITLPFSTANNPGNILDWILVSHHPDDVIIISSCSSPDTDLNDEFIQPIAEKVLQLI